MAPRRSKEGRAQGSKPQKHPKKTAKEAADRKAALACEKEQERRERERAKEEAAQRKERERRQKAVARDARRIGRRPPKERLAPGRCSICARLPFVRRVQRVSSVTLNDRTFGFGLFGRITSWVPR
jgi:hypothetical protein